MFYVVIVTEKTNILLRYLHQRWDSAQVILYNISKKT